MKKIILPLFLVILCTACSNSKHLVLTNRIFESEDDVKFSTLKFINDSICIYTEHFKCDIDKKYRDTKITCLYRFYDDKYKRYRIKRIILKNLTKNQDSLLTTCYPLPEEEIQKCSIIAEHDKVVEKKMEGVAGPMCDILYREQYGFVNNITEDTLGYWFRSNGISYTKVIKCNNWKNRIGIASFFEKRTGVGRP